MRKKIRQKLLTEVREQLRRHHADVTVSEGGDNSDMLIARPSARAGVFLIAEVTCLDSQDAVFVNVGWNSEQALDPLASDTGARFNAECGKPKATLALSAVVDVDMPLYVDPNLALWHKKQAAWYETLESGSGESNAPPPPPLAAPLADVVKNIESTVVDLVAGLGRAFSRMEAALQFAGAR
jgi:hypothetical protein